jgi:hypothetical protein
MTCIRRAALAAIIVTGLAGSASAQGNVTQADIQRLQDNVYQAGTDVAQARTRDAARANQLQAELDELRDEVIYLRVKLRKEGTLVRTEYADVRDRIENLRTRARGDTANAYTPPPAAPPAPAPAPAPANQPTAARGTTPPAATASQAGQIPVGSEFDVRISTRLNSGTTVVEDRFEATTLVDFSAGGRMLVPAGSVMRGVVTNVEPATRTNRTARMTLSFDQLTVNGRAHPIRGTVTQAIEGEGIKGEAGRVGAGAGVGAIIGGILGGFKGALAGILIGGGGTLAATEGREVDLPAGSVLRVRIDAPVQIQAAAR